MRDVSQPSAKAEESQENQRVAHVRARANWMRRRLLRMIVDAGQGHPGGDLSATDIVATLYFDILRIDPANPQRSEEHTSELQSLMRTSYAVFCLKKKKDIYIIDT